MKKFTVPVVIAIVFAGAGFFGGTKYQQSKMTANIAAGFRQRAGQAGGPNAQGRQNLQAAGFTGGQILSKDAQSITVKAQDGSSRIVFFSGSTEISKPTVVPAADLAVGDEVSIRGTSNDDGSITASMIQVRTGLPMPSGMPETSPQPK